MGSLHPNTKLVIQAPLQEATWVINGTVIPNGTNKITAPPCQKMWYKK